MTMTTTSETAPTGAHTHPHAGIWRRTTHALGNLWRKVIALPEAPSAATRRKDPLSEYYNFPPF
jgi:hypothetical protein